MEKPFDVKCLIDNGIAVVETPNLTRESINLVFEDGERFELFKPTSSTKIVSDFIWKDEAQEKRQKELYFSEYQRSRGNPLLAFEQVSYLSQIDVAIDEILNSYSE